MFRIRGHDDAQEVIVRSLCCAEVLGVELC